MHAAIGNIEAAHINAVKTQDGKRAGEAALRGAVVAGEHFGQSKSRGEKIMRPISPVVEIASDDQRRIFRRHGSQVVYERIDLVAAGTAEQGKMDANAMHRPLDPGDFDGAMEQTASLEPEMRNVLILARDDRVVRQNRVAVMAVLIHHVAAIGGVPPHIGSQELVLRLLRPGGVPAGMQVVYALDFLEKDQVGAECP